MRRQMKVVMGLVVGLSSVLFTQTLWSHCEIPCGIYDDAARIGLLREHTRTVEKAMNRIKTLKKEEDKNYNQLVRWVTNKEKHAKKIQKIVYQYFMNQRIKPAAKTATEEYKKYVEEITLLHNMLVHAMKSKQTTDHEHIEKLRELIDAFEKSYFSDKSGNPDKSEHNH